MSQNMAMYLSSGLTCLLCIDRASAIVQGRDFSTETILQELTNKEKYSVLEDSFGNSATQRLDSLNKRVGSTAFSHACSAAATCPSGLVIHLVMFPLCLQLSKNPNSQLAKQMADIEKARREREAETPEQRAMKEKLKKELAAKALGVGKNITDVGPCCLPSVRVSCMTMLCG